MRKYDWLYFDLDNTLLDFDRSSILSFYNLFEKLEVDISETDYQRYKEINHEVWMELEKGNISPDVLKIKRWDLYLKEQKLAFDPVEVNDAYFEHIKYNPVWVEGAEALIEKLKYDFQLCLITNGLTEVQLPRLELTGLDKIFKPIIISQQIGVAKPDVAFFEKAHELTDFPTKEAILVIGDTLTSDIRGGIDFGVDTCWYNHRGIENKTEYHATQVISTMSALEDIVYREA